MCEINPKHTLIFRLEAYTSDPRMTKAEFERAVVEKLMKTEMELNKDMQFRFHIHEA